MLLYLSNKTNFKRASKFFFLTSLSIVITLITYMLSLSFDFIKIFKSIGGNEHITQLKGIQKVKALRFLYRC